jgi:hypothetical protein
MVHLKIHQNKRVQWGKKQLFIHVGSTRMALATMHAQKENFP